MTTTCNGPIDINKSKSVNCSTRCGFTYNYVKSDTTVSVNSNYLSMTYGNKKSITFGNKEYYVSEVQIYWGPIHTYGSSDAKADAEMIIIHKSLTNDVLYVCVPILQSNLNTTASSNLSFLMTNITKTSQTKLSNFYNLNDFLKVAPFYTYKASSFLACTNTVDYIVYHPEDYNIAINPAALSSLKTMVSKNTAYKPVTIFKDSLSKPVLYYNKKGLSKIVDDQIYIDCQPVNKSEETVTINRPVASSIDFSTFKTNQYVQILLCFVIFIMIMYISYYSIEITTAIFSFIKLPSFA